jgi:5-formyltetrahydrofolate cyclo-ligase
MGGPNRPDTTDGPASVEPVVGDPAAAKTALRSEMRRRRRAVDDPAGRSAAIWSFVEQLPAVTDAQVVMSFTSIVGEPDTAPFEAWCRSHGKQVVTPPDGPQAAIPDATIPDVVVVPGLAFTPAGDRLGQGGGWYDRFLAGIGPSTVTVGVGFAVQLVDSLPVEAHDVRLDHVVTEAGPSSSDVRSVRPDRS